MLCKRCRKNLATVRYAEVVDGHVRHIGLCPECLAKYEADSVVGFELSKPVSGADRRQADFDSVSEGVEERCKACGHGQSRRLETGRVGCCQCYETFSEDVESFLARLHPAVRHRGKTPYVDDARVRVLADLQSKRALLRSALQTENYEEAAHLRDEIHVLERELSCC